MSEHVGYEPIDVKCVWVICKQIQYRRCVKDYCEEL